MILQNPEVAAGAFLESLLTGDGPHQQVPNEGLLATFIPSLSGKKCQNFEYLVTLLTTKNRKIENFELRVYSSKTTAFFLS